MKKSFEVVIHLKAGAQSTQKKPMKYLPTFKNQFSMNWGNSRTEHQSKSYSFVCQAVTSVEKNKSTIITADWLRQRQLCKAVITTNKYGGTYIQVIRKKFPRIFSFFGSPNYVYKQMRLSKQTKNIVFLERWAVTLTNFGGLIKIWSLREHNKFFDKILAK